MRERTPSSAALIDILCQSLARYDARERREATRSLAPHTKREVRREHAFGDMRRTR